jgi:hypothetical protein
MEKLWSKIEGWAKAHPMATGLIIFAVGAVLIYLFSRGSSTAATATAGQPSDAYYQAEAAVAASGNQLQAAQLQAQAQSTAYGDQLTAANNDIAGQVTLAQIQAQQNTTVASLQEKLGLAQTSAQESVANTASTLTAQVQQAGITAQTNIANINATAATTQAQTAANEQLGIAATNAQVAESSTQAQLAATEAGYSAQTLGLGLLTGRAAGESPAGTTFGPQGQIILPAAA